MGKHNKDDLGKRMKEYYEQISQSKLTRRMPVAIRIDGKAFHTFTRGFEKPFDPVMIKTMQSTMKFLCEHIQGCVLGYTQSDEITLILVDYKNLNSSAWFDYKVQKMCSISASMATMAFNRFFPIYANEVIEDVAMAWNTGDEWYHKYSKISVAYEKAIESGAMFDARCFNIPREEVTNLIYWRQVDASKNSVQMLGRAYYAPKQMYGKGRSAVKNMLLEEQNVNWDELPTTYKIGSCCVKDEEGHWVIDNEIPLFKDTGRQYIEQLICFD